MESEARWYKKTYSIVLLLIFFFPIGVYLMWKYGKWSNRTKLIITGIFSLYVLGVYGSVNQKPVVSQTDTKVNATTASTSPTPSPKPVQTKRIDVTSQIVRKVDGKYRYFFDIRNNDTSEFNGSVTISLYTSKLKNPLGKESFNTTKPIGVGLGDSVYFDINTGPVSEHGENGITKYSYSVLSDGVEVNKGEGLISSDFKNILY